MQATKTGFEPAIKAHWGKLSEKDNFVWLPFKQRQTEIEVSPLVDLFIYFFYLSG